MDVTTAERAPAAARLGRRPATSRAKLSHVALQLFAERGFEATTVDDIAAAAGIGRRTFFRYFASKNDVAWGDFEAELAKMRAYLRAMPPDVPLMEALRASVLEFNRLPPEEIPNHRQRMELLLHVPALLAHSTLRYRAWREVVAEYAAERLGLPAGSQESQTIAWALLGVALAAYEQWLAQDDADLTELLDTSLRLLSTGFERQTR